MEIFPSNVVLSLPWWKKIYLWLIIRLMVGLNTAMNVAFKGDGTFCGCNSS